MRSPLITVLLLASLATSSPVFAQAPDELSFQGYVTDSVGTPISHPGIPIRFRLTDVSAPVWLETQPSVKIVDGVFNVRLGSVVPLDTVRFNRPLLLRIKVGTDPEIQPHTPLGTAAYAKALPGLYAYYHDDGSYKSYNVVGGAANNFVGSGVVGATIGGGGGFLSITPYPNSVLDDFGTVSGGWGNSAAARSSFIGGGWINTASGEEATVGGGSQNTASGPYSTIGGGLLNTASGFYATIGGGGENTADTSYATVGGGWVNTASGAWATVPGGIANSARGFASFAAGHDAKAIHDGTFVWNDRSITTGNDSLLSTGPNQFLIRAAGGVGIGTNSPGNHDLAINGSGSGISGATLEVENLSTGSGIAAHFETNGTDAALVIDQDGTGDHIKTFDDGNLRFRVTDAGNVTAHGTITGGGADVAEAVEVEGMLTLYEPGDVMVVSADRNRTFEKSFEPYASALAGVYASKPGLVLTERGISEDLSDRIPLGIVGIIATKVSAENGSISRGDLLVTSSTPGHAMRAEPIVMNGIEIYPTGVVLGKALEPFEGPGMGMIEVLVNVK